MKAHGTSRESGCRSRRERRRRRTGRLCRRLALALVASLLLLLALVLAPPDPLARLLFRHAAGRAGLAEWSARSVRLRPLRGLWIRELDCSGRAGTGRFRVQIGSIALAYRLERLIRGELSVDRVEVTPVIVHWQELPEAELPPRPPSPPSGAPDLARLADAVAAAGGRWQSWVTRDAAVPTVELRRLRVGPVALHAAGVQLELAPVEVRARVAPGVSDPFRARVISCGAAVLAVDGAAGPLAAQRLALGGSLRVEATVAGLRLDLGLEQVGGSLMWRGQEAGLAGGLTLEGHVRQIDLARAGLSDLTLDLDCGRAGAPIRLALRGDIDRLALAAAHLRAELELDPRGVPEVLRAALRERLGEADMELPSCRAALSLDGRLAESNPSCWFGSLADGRLPWDGHLALALEGGPLALRGWTADAALFEGEWSGAGIARVAGASISGPPPVGPLGDAALDLEWGEALLGPAGGTDAGLRLRAALDAADLTLAAEGRGDPGWPRRLVERLAGSDEGDAGEALPPEARTWALLAETPILIACEGEVGRLAGLPLASIPARLAGHAEFRAELTGGEPWSLAVEAVSAGLDLELHGGELMLGGTEGEMWADLRGDASGPRALDGAGTFAVADLCARAAEAEGAGARGELWLALPDPAAGGGRGAAAWLRAMLHRESWPAPAGLELAVAARGAPLRPLPSLPSPTLPAPDLSPWATLLAAASPELAVEAALPVAWLARWLPGADPGAGAPPSPLAGLSPLAPHGPLDPQARPGAGNPDRRGSSREAGMPATGELTATIVAAVDEDARVRGAATWDVRDAGLDLGASAFAGLAGGGAVSFAVGLDDPGAAALHGLAISNRVAGVHWREPGAEYRARDLALELKVDAADRHGLRGAHAAFSAGRPRTEWMLAMARGDYGELLAPRGGAADPVAWLARALSLDARLEGRTELGSLDEFLPPGWQMRGTLESLLDLQARPEALATGRLDAALGGASVLIPGLVSIEQLEGQLSLYRQLELGDAARAPRSAPVLGSEGAPSRLQAERVEVGGLVLEAVRLSPEIGSDRWQLRDFSCVIGGGKVHGEAAVRAAPERSRMEGSIRFSRVDVGQLLRLPGLPARAEERWVGGNLTVAWEASVPLSAREAIERIEARGHIIQVGPKALESLLRGLDPQGADAAIQQVLGWCRRFPGQLTPELSMTLARGRLTLDVRLVGLGLAQRIEVPAGRLFSADAAERLAVAGARLHELLRLGAARDLGTGGI